MIHIPTDICAKITLEAGTLDSLSNAPSTAWLETRMAFLNSLSQALRRRSDCKKMPDIMALSFWLRRANLATIKAQSGHQNGIQVGLGVTFHISPSNVPVNFAYSLAFALLAGNTCVVRLPSGESEASHILIEEIKRLLQHEDFQELTQYIALIRYPHDDEITQFWLAQADGRVFWGGDETIQHMQRFATPTRSREIAFADRYSIAVAHAQTVADMDKEALSQVAESLYNDVYLMDQAACSSPQLFAWIGSDEDIVKAQQNLWPKLDAVAQRKYELSDSQAMGKFINICDLVIDAQSPYLVTQESPYLTRIQVSSLSPEQQTKRGYNGTIFEVALSNLNQLAPIVNERYQTLSYLGFTYEQLIQFISEQQLRGFDRVVPVGQALQMEHIWDGYDVISSLSRFIRAY